MPSSVSLGASALALALEQFGILDPTQMIGLFIVIGAAIVGLLSTGILGGGDAGSGGAADPHLIAQVADETGRAALAALPRHRGSSVREVTSRACGPPARSSGRPRRSDRGRRRPSPARSGPRRRSCRRRPG